MLRKEPRNTEAPHINIQSPKKTSQHIKFSHKKKYCGIKDIRVLFYSSIFQLIIVFPFLVLKYFSFCCHSSHSILFRNPLFYSSFVLFVKSDSKLNQNSSCQFFILFHFCLLSVSVYSLFFFPIPCLYLFCFSCYFVFVLFCLFYYFFFIYSVFPVTLSFLLLCLSSFCFPVTLSLCYSVFPLILSLCHSVYFCHSVFFHVFVAHSLPYFSFHFQLSFYGFISLFFDIFA